jgi:FkbM family methyltransferase
MALLALLQGGALSVPHLGEPVLRLCGVRARQDGTRWSLDLPDGRVLATPSRASIPESLHVRLSVSYLDEYNVAALCPRGGVVLDVGAHIGCFTLAAARAHAAKIVALEPVPGNVECLRATIEANKIEGATVIPVAAGAAVGGCERATDGAHHARYSSVLAIGAQRVRAPVRPIDQTMGDLRLDSLDFVKIDAEGMEREVLAGARETISRHRPTLAVAAYH